MSHSSAVSSMLAKLQGVELLPDGQVRFAESSAAQAGQATSRLFGEPRLELLKDAAEPIDEIVASLAAVTPDGKRLQRRLSFHDPNIPQWDPSTRKVLLNGRECCWVMAQRLSSLVHLLEIPSAHRCPDCGSVWQLVHRVSDRGGFPNVR